MAKVVFITSRFPYPFNKGDKLRAYYQIRSLSKSNEVHLISINEKKVSDEFITALTPYCRTISVFPISGFKRLLSLFLCPFRKWPFQIGYFYNSRIKKKIDAIIRDIDPDFIHSHLIRVSEYVKSNTNIEKTLDFMDAFSWGMQKRAGIEKNIFKKYFFNYEYKYLQKYETSMFNYFDHFTAISEQDSKAIINHGSKEIVIVPNGVDFSSFYPKNCEKKYDVCFMGNLDYPPNIEAVLFANKYIFPGLLSKKHNCKILIAGANPPLKIKALHTTNIDVIENFIDISDSIAISKVMLSPMIVSIGLQNKIIQAMAMKVPNVVSRHANNAINAKHEHSIFVADNPEDYIKYIIMLLNEETIRNEIAENAFYFVKERHSWDIVNLLLEKTIKGNKNEIRPD